MNGAGEVSIRLHRGVRNARHWPDLVRVLDLAQEAFVARRIYGPVVEDLAETCRVRSREIPEHA